MSENDIIRLACDWFEAEVKMLRSLGFSTLEDMNEQEEYE